MLWSFAIIYMARILYIYICVRVYNTPACGRRGVNIASKKEYIKVQWDEKYKAFKGYNRQFMRTSVSTLYDTS